MRKISRFVRSPLRFLRPLTIPGVCLLGLLLAAPSALAKVSASREVQRSQIAEGDAAGAGQIETFTTPALAGETDSRALLPGEVLGEQLTLVSLVHFTNDPSTPHSFLDVENEIYSAAVPTSAASYVLEASYGRAWLTKSNQVVVGQLPAGYDDTNCLIRTQAGMEQLVDELDILIDFSIVDRWIVMIPKNFNCGFVGLSSLGKWTFDTGEGIQSFSWIILNGPSLPWGPLVAHELGHSFGGLQHSADWECGTETIGAGCTETGTDRYDVMAASVNDGHYTPSGKQALEWFDTQIVDVTGPGGTFVIEPYETTGPGIKALRIQADGPYNDYGELDDYWVSYRKPLGFDAGFTELSTDGAMLHLGTRYFPEFTTDATGRSLLLDAKPGSAAGQEADSQDVLLEAGQTFVDTARGITIETLGTLGSGLEVQVTIDQYCGNGLRDTAIGEVCEGADLGGATCSSLGLTSGTLACNASCGFDTSACGAAVCEVGDSYDEGSGLCTASFLGAGPIHMGLYKNAALWSDARNATSATLLTLSRGYFAAAHNFVSDRDVLFRMNLPFDTSALPDGATIDSATLHLKLDAFPGTMTNTHPSSADQLVLVQTNDPQPTVREKSDFGAFPPVDSPPEGAPRVDVSDTLVLNQPFQFDLNATGLSWIDDTGFTLLGMRSAYDVDDVTFAPPETQQLNFYVVPPDSPIAGPRLEVSYHPLPEPGVAAGLVSGWALLARLRRRRSRSSQPRPR